MIARWTVLSCCMVAAALPAAAHDSPGDVIHALSHRIETAGPTARLLAARAFEYEYLGQWDEAASDFEAALEMQPKYGAALTGLAQVLLRKEQLDRAEAVARQGLDLESDRDRQAPYWAICAKVGMARADWEAGLAAWRGALTSSRPEVDWFLGEAECLARLDRPDERVTALAAAIERNPSVVLHRTWIRALVDAAHLEDADREIAAGLEKAHWKSTWLLLRARVHALRQERAEQQADAADALTEIRARWNRKHPDQDPYLVADAALAYALLGEIEEARVHMEKARSQGIPDARLVEIEAYLPEVRTTKP